MSNPAAIRFGGNLAKQAAAVVGTTIAVGKGALVLAALTNPITLTLGAGAVLTAGAYSLAQKNKENTKTKK